ncbi:MAG: hypothetical protein RMM53_02160 [Bacteroidia bacterium]|nr:hypothetical protein [Bacteroidia bacterium]MDW8332999.1 hypothetical protein [Bacteroidia bacterium]
MNRWFVVGVLIVLGIGLGGRTLRTTYDANAPDSVGCAKAKEMGYKALEFCRAALENESERERNLHKADDHLLILKHYAADDHCACYKVEYNNNKARKLLDQALATHVKDSVKIYVELAVEKINGVIAVIQRCEYENRQD